MKNLSLFLIFLTFIISSCSEEDKEHTVEKQSRWTQTIRDTTYNFRLYWKGGYKGNGKEQLIEHYGDCEYHSYPKGKNPTNYMGTHYRYDRDGDNIKIYENIPINNPQITPPIWLQGHIANDIMFLSNDTLSFELQKVKSFVESPL